MKLTLTNEVYEGIAELAKKAGMSPAAYINRLCIKATAKPLK